jgi:hypothetical protein
VPCLGIHRLDEATSGLLAFALSYPVQRGICLQLQGPGKQEKGRGSSQPRASASASVPAPAAAPAAAPVAAPKTIQKVYEAVVDTRLAEANMRAAVRAYCEAQGSTATPAGAAATGAIGADDAYGLPHEVLASLHGPFGPVSPLLYSDEGRLDSRLQAHAYLPLVNLMAAMPTPPAAPAPVEEESGATEAPDVRCPVHMETAGQIFSHWDGDSVSSSPADIGAPRSVLAPLMAPAGATAATAATAPAAAPPPSEGAAGTQSKSQDDALVVTMLSYPRVRSTRRPAKPCVTHWRVLERGRGAVRLRLEPLTGRTHQLRLHCGLPVPYGLGAPIVGDDFYGDGAGLVRRHYSEELASRTYAFLAQAQGLSAEEITAKATHCGILPEFLEASQRYHAAYRVREQAILDAVARGDTWRFPYLASSPLLSGPQYVSEAWMTNADPVLTFHAPRLFLHARELFVPDLFPGTDAATRTLTAAGVLANEPGMPAWTIAKSFASTQDATASGNLKHPTDASATVSAEAVDAPSVVDIADSSDHVSKKPRMMTQQEQLADLEGGNAAQKDTALAPDAPKKDVDDDASNGDAEEGGEDGGIGNLSSPFLDYATLSQASIQFLADAEKEYNVQDRSASVPRKVVIRTSEKTDTSAVATQEARPRSYLIEVIRSTPPEPEMEPDTNIPPAQQEQTTTQTPSQQALSGNTFYRPSIFDDEVLKQKVLADLGETAASVSKRQLRKLMHKAAKDAEELQGPVGRSKRAGIKGDAAIVHFVAPTPF